MPSNTTHIFDFLNSSPEDPFSGVCALFGGERFLKQLALEVLTPQGDDFSVIKFDGNQADFAGVTDELATRSLFGGSGPKIVVVDEADSFVKQNRDRLEAIVESKQPNLLVLVVDSWAANTRLYKQIDKHGFQIRCDAPLQGRSKSRTRNVFRVGLLSVPNQFTTS